MYKSEVRPMIYSGNNISEVLYEEINDDGFNLVVVNTRGQHPCAYVQFPDIYKLNDYDSIDVEYGVHGGFTYLNVLNAYLDHEGNPFEGRWLGWDYAHCDDRICYGDEFESRFPNFNNGTEWSSAKVIDEGHRILSSLRNGRYVIRKEDL